MPKNDGDAVTILVVDDDIGHGELIRRNLRRAAFRNRISIVHSGEEALEFVRTRIAKSGTSEDNRLLLLLDINMPGPVNGMDVLRQLKADPSTRVVPVVMLTSTNNPDEVARCYSLGCNVYVAKPLEPSEFIDAIQRIGLFVEIVSIAPLPAEPGP